MLTTFDEEEYLYEALRAGTSGFLLKVSPPEQLIGAIRTVAAGNALIDPAVTRRVIAAFGRRVATKPPPSTPARAHRPRARGAASCWPAACRNQEIASELIVGDATVKTHVARVLMKLGLRDRVQAVVFAYEHGIVEPGGDAGRLTPSPTCAPRSRRRPPACSRSAPATASWPRSSRSAGYDVTAIDPKGGDGVLPVALDDLDAPPRSFDAAVAMLSLHHVVPLGRSLRRLSEVLRHGARLVVDEFDVDALRRARRRLVAQALRPRARRRRPRRRDARAPAPGRPTSARSSTSGSTSASRSPAPTSTAGTSTRRCATRRSA